MKLTERRQYQARFAASYVELASQLVVSPDDLIVGIHSHTAVEALKQSGYPVDHEWMLSERANGILRNDYVQNEIKRLARTRLADDPSPNAERVLAHLVKCGRVSMPDFEKIVEEIGVPIEELKEINGRNQLPDFYRWKKREAWLASELSMSVEQFEQLAREQGLTPQELYDQKIEQESQNARQEIWDNAQNASKVWAFLKDHDICSDFLTIMDNETRTTVLVDLIRSVAQRHVWLLELAKIDPEEVPYVEKDITDLMASEGLTWDEAAARIQADWESNKQREREQEEEDVRVEQFVRTLDREMTMKQIKEATGHRNIITMGRIIKRLADESVIEPLPRYYRVDTRVVPRYQHV